MMKGIEIKENYGTANQCHWTEASLGSNHVLFRNSHEPRLTAAQAMKLGNWLIKAARELSK